MVQLLPSIWCNCSISLLNASMFLNLSSTEISYLSLNQKIRTLQTNLTIVASLYSQRSANYWRRSFLPDHSYQVPSPWNHFQNTPPARRLIRPGYSCLHTAFLFQETIAHLRERKKVYVALLDVKNPLTQCDMLVFSSNYNKQELQGKEHSTCSVLWNGKPSQTIHINQGVKQGGVLSLFLYNLYVNNLLVELENSGLGARVGDIFTGAPNACMLIIWPWSPRPRKSYKACWTLSRPMRRSGDIAFIQGNPKSWFRF